MRGYKLTNVCVLCWQKVVVNPVKLWIPHWSLYRAVTLSPVHSGKMSTPPLLNQPSLTTKHLLLTWSVSSIPLCSHMYWSMHTHAWTHTCIFSLCHCSVWMKSCHKPFLLAHPSAVLFCSHHRNVVWRRHSGNAKTYFKLPKTLPSFLHNCQTKLTVKERWRQVLP